MNIFFSLSMPISLSLSLSLSFTLCVYLCKTKSTITTQHVLRSFGHEDVLRNRQKYGPKYAGGNGDNYPFTLRILTECTSCQFGQIFMSE